LLLLTLIYEGKITMLGLGESCQTHGFDLANKTYYCVIVPYKRELLRHMAYYLLRHQINTH
jgi:hypothetical protein